MNILLKKVKIIDPDSSHHNKVRDILIEGGKIKKIGKTIEGGKEKVVSEKNLHISRGWIDLMAQFHDPGNEHKEDLESGCRAAARGGFTRVGLSPATLPARDSKSQLEYVARHNRESAVELIPYGTISKGLEGKELAEMADMHQVGARAFTDGLHSLQNTDLLKKALMYVQSFDGLIMHFSLDNYLAAGGMMNEGEVSTSLGLKGIPSLAEEISVSRDLLLQSYTGGRLHFTAVSSTGALGVIKEAQDQKSISCDLCSYNLLLTDEELTTFDSRLKVLPPLRNRKDQKEYLKYIKNGTIKALISNHYPEDIDSKMREFSLSNFGMINLQTSFAVANTALHGKIELQALIHLFTTGPASVLRLEQAPIEEGAAAELTLFDPEAEFIFKKEDVVSKSDNSPLFGRKLKGRVYGIIHRGKAVIH
jgi:dihydroorotase